MLYSTSRAEEMSREQETDKIEKRLSLGRSEGEDNIDMKETPNAVNTDNAILESVLQAGHSKNSRLSHKTCIFSRKIVSPCRLTSVFVPYVVSQRRIAFNVWQGQAAASSLAGPVKAIRHADSHETILDILLFRSQKPSQYRLCLLRMYRNTRSTGRAFATKSRTLAPLGAPCVSRTLRLSTTWSADVDELDHCIWNTHPCSPPPMSSNLLASESDSPA